MSVRSQVPLILASQCVTNGSAATLLRLLRMGGVGPGREPRGKRAPHDARDLIRQSLSRAFPVQQMDGFAHELLRAIDAAERKRDG